MSRRVSRLRRSLRASVLDGSAHAAMVGCGETYFPAFALFLGASAFQAGLLTTVPVLVGGAFQLFAASAAAVVGNRRWVVGSAILQALTFPLVAALVLVDPPQFPWLLGVVCLYWMLALGVSPAWNAWMGAMIPPSVLSRFFSRRNVPVQIVLLLSIVASGTVLHLGGVVAGEPATAFVLIFLGACAARIVSAVFLVRQHERPRTETTGLVSLGVAARALRHQAYGRVILLIVMMNGAVNVSAAYFTPYMLDELGLSYGRFTLLNATIFVSRILFAAYWGEIARAFGNRRALQVSTLLLVPLSGLWVISGNFAYLVCLQIVAGFAWAGFELMIVLSLFDCSDDGNRARVLSLYNLMNGIAIVVASLVGGMILSVLGSDGYVYLFLGSSMLRLIVVLAFGRDAGVRRSEEHSFRDVFVRTVTLRPGQGAVVRPIVLPPRLPVRRHGRMRIRGDRCR